MIAGWNQRSGVLVVINRTIVGVDASERHPQSICDFKTFHEFRRAVVDFLRDEVPQHWAASATESPTIFASSAAKIFGSSLSRSIAGLARASHAGNLLLVARSGRSLADGLLDCVKVREVR